VLHGLPIAEHILAANIRSVEILPGIPYEPAPEIGAYIRKRLRQNPIQFDGVSWRMESYLLENDLLVLKVGFGKYSQYRYTNLDPEARRRFPNQGQWFNALAIGVVLVTADSKIYFKRRPQNVHLSPGRIDIPCGHPSTLKASPSTSSLWQALEMVVSKEVGKKIDLEFCFGFPIALIREEPKRADDLVFAVSTTSTSEDLRSVTEFETFFLDINPDAVGAFLKSDIEVSRPVPLALAHFGLRLFGRSWFESLCQFPN